MTAPRPAANLIAIILWLSAAVPACGGDSEDSDPPVDSGDVASDAPEDVAADLPGDTGLSPSDTADEDPGPSDLDADQDAGPEDIVDAVDAEDAPLDVPEDAVDIPEDIEEDVPPPPPPYWLDLPEGYAQAHVEDVPVDLSGKTDDIDVIAPDGTLSVTVMISGAPDPIYMRLAKAVTPKGNAVVKGQGTLLCITCANRVYASQLLTTSMIPNSPEVPYQDKGKFRLGLWQFKVVPVFGGVQINPYAETPLTARVLFKLFDGEPEAGTIDLNLFFTGAGEIDAENAPEHERVVEMLADLGSILEPAGIAIGTVSYFDAPEATPMAVETTVGTDSDLAELLKTSDGAPPGINVFFVSTIVKTEVEDGSSGVVLGIAGGVPGPPWLAHGSIHSGVALALDPTIGSEGDITTDKLGATLAHELGHYLGLYHNTEKGDPEKPELTTHDPIADTEDSDKTNLMWWASEGGLTLTDGQRFVVMRHPSVWLSPPITPPDP